LSNFVNTIYQAMVTYLGASWIVAIILLITFFIIMVMLSGDIPTSLIFTLMVISVFVIAGVFTTVVIGYIVLAISLIFALIFARIFAR